MAVDGGACLVDINMGCPARKVTAGLCGSALMREPALAARIVAAVRAAVPPAIPVTVKQRAGWDELSLNAAEFARAMVRRGRRDGHRARTDARAGLFRHGPAGAHRRGARRPAPRHPGGRQRRREVGR